MLTVCCSKWNRPDGRALFAAVHVNVLRAALERHLPIAHELVCVTDDPAGIDPGVRIVPLPTTYAQTPRCRRRMQFFSREFCATLGSRILYLDLDMVIVGDLTPMLVRAEPIVMWRVQHAQTYSGSIVLTDAGALDGAWQRFAADPDGFPREAWPRGIGSDQAMLNYWLRNQPPIGEWTDADGIVTFYGKGYERFEHLGVGPSRRNLPPGARIVVLGSDDLFVLGDPAYPWVKTDWLAHVRVAERRAS